MFTPGRIGTPYHGPVAALRAPDGHVRRRQAADEGAEDGEQRAVEEPQLEEQRAEHPRGEVVERDVCAEPHDGDLQVVAEARGAALLGQHARDAAGLEAGEALDARVEGAQPRGDDGGQRRGRGIVVVVATSSCA